MLSPGLLDLVHGLLEYDPKKRLLAPAALAMPYFTTEDPPMQLPSQCVPAPPPSPVEAPILSPSR